MSYQWKHISNELSKTHIKRRFMILKLSASSGKALNKDAGEQRWLSWRRTHPRQNGISSSCVRTLRLVLLVLPRRAFSRFLLAGNVELIWRLSLPTPEDQKRGGVAYHRNSRPLSVHNRARIAAQPFRSQSPSINILLRFAALHGHFRCGLRELLARGLAINRSLHGTRHDHNHFGYHRGGYRNDGSQNSS